MFELLRTLNNNSPFLWEVTTDGFAFEIYCEGGLFEEKDGRVMSCLTEDECVEELQKLIKDVR